MQACQLEVYIDFVQMNLATVQWVTATMCAMVCVRCWLTWHLWLRGLRLAGLCCGQAVVAAQGVVLLCTFLLCCNQAKSYV